MSQRNLGWLIAVPVAVVFVAFMSATTPPPEPEYKLVRTVVDVLADVDKNFYRKLTDDEKQKLVEDMVNGGLQRLDPHAAYFNEEQLRRFTEETEGAFGGIGAIIGVDPKTGILSIDSPMPDSPALAAGLQNDDLIVQIEGKSTEGMPRDEAIPLIKGEPGTTVTLTILRPRTGKTFDVELTRAVIQLHPVKGYERRADDPTKWSYFADEANKIAYIRLSEFSRSAAKELGEALAAAEAGGARALVLDMRGNGGGLLSMAVEVADMFLAGGSIVRTRDRSDSGRDAKAKDDGTIWESAARMPMAVLVNQASASATEIVAAALQDHGRAVVIGMRTYGKGSVQKSFEAADGKSALKITTELWLTPNGKNIHRWPTSKKDDEWGVRPDPGLEVPMTPEQNVQLILHWQEAERIRQNRGDHEPPPTGPAQKDGEPTKKDPDQPDRPKLDPNFKDPVLEKAIEHLKKKVTEVGQVPPRGPKPA